MKVLAICTSGRVCSIGITDGARVLAETAFEHEMRLLETLMPRVADLLRAAGLELCDVDKLAADIGPGSFTGVRIGVMTAKTLAWAANKPLAGVTSLAAISHEVPQEPATDLLVTVKARPGYAYWQAFTCMESRWLARGDIELSRLSDIANRLPAMHSAKLSIAACDLGSSDIEALTAYLRARGFAIADFREAHPAARAVAALASHDPAAGATEDPLALVPRYVAEPHIGVRRDR